MKINKRLSFITAVLTMASLILILSLHPNDEGNPTKFSNIMLAVFGSSLLVSISSFIGYFVERHRYIMKYSGFARHFFSKIGISEKYLIKNSSPDTVYNEVHHLLDFYNGFIFENYTEAKYYYCSNGKYKRNMELLQDTVTSFRKKLLDVEKEAEYAIENPDYPYQYSTSISAKELKQAREIILDAENPKRNKTNERKTIKVN